ncbi:histidine-rich glycoprotein-like [Stegodyphus dumicola]|uniref:histidine-rich glycoprotein-like n=1 Tax=Stegodyphus dumicola TaxID=202533 RepID=UPI0015AC9E24|nr:histidine-rich glycoprotein-like [Stegodyphus dumicola]
MAKRILIVVGFLVLLAYVSAGPVKAKEVEEKVEEYEDDLEEAEDQDLVPEGGAHLGRYVGGRDRDYEEHYGEEEGYEGKAGHEKAHKAGGVHSYDEHHEQGGFKKFKDEHAAHGKHDKEGHEVYEHHNDQGASKSFKKEGEVFDKHGSDHKGKLEKNQHVKGQEEVTKHGGHGQAGGKVGSEFIKDKGHKSHGFKNVYHKEEFGEHKTFHDEHRETDHKKKYHDEHQDYSHHGGKHFKQHANKGHYDENKHGHDFHKFGKAGHESHHEAGHKKGGHHHAVGDGFKQAGGKQQSEAHAQGHHSRGKKVYHNGQLDVGHQHKAHLEAAHGHRGYGGHKKAAGYDDDRRYHGHQADKGYYTGYEDVGDGHHVYFRRG